MALCLQIGQMWISRYRQLFQSIVSLVFMPCIGQDKWRNLNMEAREEAFEQLQPDDDPDFRVRQLTSQTSATFCLLAC